MPKGYVCSNCGAPVSPAQNRCHRCGAEIDWAKAVGRVSYIQHLPDARRRKRRYRRLLAALLLGLLLGLGLWQARRLPWVQTHWRTWQQLQQGNLRAASAEFGRLFHTQEETTPASTPTPAPPPSPVAVIPIQPTAPATASPLPSSPTPTATRAATPTPTARPQEEEVQQLLESAQALLPQAPCRAAERLQQALNLADTPDIAARYQAAQAQCQQSNATIAPATGQQIAYTAYDSHAQRYSLLSWQLGEHLPGPRLMDWAMQPAFGPQGQLLFRSTDPDRPGIALLNTDGSVRRITKGEDDSWPRWGPGGEQLLFSASLRSPDGSPHIYLADIASRSVEDLGPGQHADWSRTGRIVFSDCDSSGQQCGLWLLDPTTLQRSQLTDSPGDLAPVWSPDGRYIALMSGNRSSSWDIFLLDVETGSITAIAPHPDEDGLPAWSPDGHDLAFLSNREGDWAIYRWRLTDAQLVRLFPVGPELPNWQQAGLSWRDAFTP